MSARNFDLRSGTTSVLPAALDVALVWVSVELLNECRLAAMACRSLGRASLFEACAMLSSNRATARAAYLETLVRCLPQATGRALRLHRPGASELTFDEAWLMQMFDSLSRHDTSSFEFLLRSRVDRAARRNLVFLLSRISDLGTARPLERSASESGRIA